MDIFYRIDEMVGEIEDMVSRCDDPENLSVYVGHYACNMRHGEKYCMSSGARWFGEGKPEKSSLIDGFLHDIEPAVLVSKVVEHAKDRCRETLVEAAVTFEEYAETLRGKM